MLASVLSNTQAGFYHHDPVTNKRRLASAMSAAFGLELADSFGVAWLAHGPADIDAGRRSQRALSTRKT